MVNIYLLRHGETLFNLKEKVQGWNDSPLTEKGIYQARCAGYGMRDTVFSKVYAGDVLRQIDTAKIFISENRNPLEIIPDPHFREMCYGKYEGGTYREMLGPLFELNGAEYGGYEGLYHFYNDIEIARLLEERDETGVFEGVERVWKRFSEGIEMICNSDEGNVMVSTSSFAIAAVIYKLFPAFKQPSLVANAAITVITYDEGFKLSDYNNTSYREAGEKHFGL